MTSALRYDPELGRWNRPDPMYYADPGVSPYAFVGNDPLNRYDVRGLLKASQYVWNVEWQLNWSAEYQNGITGDFTTTGGVSVYGDGRGTLIVSGRNFSLTFTGIEGAMSFEYKKALEEGRIYLEYLRNMMWTSVYFEKLDASFKAQIMDASGSLIKFPNPLKEDDGFVIPPKIFVIFKPLSDL